MIRHLRFILLTGLIFLSITSFLSAGSEISWIEGTVTITRDSRDVNGEIGTELFEADRITTGPDSLLIIEMEGRGTLKLREETTMVLESMDGDIAVALVRGGLFSRIRRLFGKGYEVYAPNVVAAVRGTEFFVAYGRNIEEDPDLWLCVNEGAVEVALEDSGDSVMVEEGEGINILGSNRITDPKFYPWTEDLNWNTDPSAGDVDDSTNLDGAYADLRDFDYD